MNRSRIKSIESKVNKTYQSPVVLLIEEPDGSIRWPDRHPISDSQMKRLQVQNATIILDEEYIYDL